MATKHQIQLRVFVEVNDEDELRSYAQGLLPAADGEPTLGAALAAIFGDAKLAATLINELTTVDAPCSAPGMDITGIYCAAAEVRTL